MTEKSIVTYLQQTETRYACHKFAEMLQGNSFSNKDIEDSFVIKVLDEIIGDDAGIFHYTLNNGFELFRARIITKNEDLNTNQSGISADFPEDAPFFSTGFDKYGSKEAPMGKPPAARNNIEGMSYLYLAEDPYTACAEIRPINRCLVSLATFRVQSDIHILNFVHHNTDISKYLLLEEKIKVSPNGLNVSLSELFTWFMEIFYRSVGESKGYIASQIISDYIRKAGIDGIRYLSSMSGGTNITIFNSHESKISFSSSKLVFVPSQQFDIIDLNSGDRIIPRDDFVTWKDDGLNDVRIQIASAIKRATKKEIK